MWLAPKDKKLNVFISVSVLDGDIWVSTNAAFSIKDGRKY